VQCVVDAPLSMIGMRCFLRSRIAKWVEFHPCAEIIAYPHCGRSDGREDADLP